MLRENFIMEQGYCNRYMEKAMVQKITIAFPCSGRYLLKRILGDGERCFICGTLLK